MILWRTFLCLKITLKRHLGPLADSSMLSSLFENRVFSDDTFSKSKLDF